VPHVVQFNAPRDVSLVEHASEPLVPGHVRVRTWYSGISAGTELTAYRGTNPYLSHQWDAETRVFRAGTPTFAYPLVGWGYSEVGEVVEVADDVEGLAPGQVVHGIWGHRSEAVVPADRLQGQVLEAGTDPLRGTFARVGAIALNAVLAADVSLGDQVAVFGQGVIGLLATRLAELSGAEVVAVDGHEQRLAVARALGAGEVLRADVEGGAGMAVRELTRGGADAAIELSGNHRALHEAIRSVVQDAVVVAAGFYQGGASELRLGEEFHHNRVRLVASQIANTPLGLGPRWDQRRLVRAFMRQVQRDRVDVLRLVTDVVDAREVAKAFERLDRDDPEVLQMVLRFDAAPT
jgi:2-desacetyl-2-hydroxyethyl bacteriochlorophyllide A dehydrogenase